MIIKSVISLMLLHTCISFITAVMLMLTNLISQAHSRFFNVAWKLGMGLGTEL
jgi:hypothetical protein